MQIIHQDRIEKSTARSVTDLLAENAVGFMSEWTPGQTSINIRGAATDGQGRDFRSQVLVLINGHRAGTANVSKLSVADIQRIEIVRGPASVVYGSQNMGGVINIILKTGRTAPGNLVEASIGSWNLYQGTAQSGGVIDKFDYYAGVAASTRTNYQVGGGKIEENTGWTRFGGTAALGYQIDDNNRIDMTVRTDGIYDAGFRGSAANIFAFDTRYNRSVDMSYNGKIGDARQHLLPGLLRPGRRRSQQSVAAQRAERGQPAHDGRSQQAPARHRRHPLPAELQVRIRQRDAARLRLGAKLAALGPQPRRR